MTTRLYLVRHGATQLTAEDRFSGSIGVDLSDEGRAQALEPAWRASRQQAAQDQAQVESCHMHQQTFENVLVPTQVRAPHSARFVTVGKGALDQFPTLT